MEITRKQLVSAIEAGIDEAGRGLSVAERMALRSVGLVADKVAVRAFKINDCGCPLTQIGLNRDEVVENSDLYWRFFEADGGYGYYNLNKFYQTFDSIILDTLELDRDSCSFIAKVVD